MEFYESISSVYDYIFPLNKAQEDFIFRFTKAAPADFNLLDAGCATGSLALSLAEKGVRVRAFDFDRGMIKLAKKKKQNCGLTDFPVFEQLDMRLMDQHYDPESFNQLVCFGNTLVHLQNQVDILQFLNAAYSVLRKGANLLIQILNYDFILSEKLASLPLIENEYIRFERFYEYPQGSELINFKTELLVKSTGSKIGNHVILLPLRKEELGALLLKAGFRNPEFFGNFKGETIQPRNLPLIVKAEK